MERKTRFLVAMAVYAVLAILIWVTMDSGAVEIHRAGGKLLEIPFRNLTVGIVGLFAALTFLHWRINEREARREHEDSGDGLEQARRE
jgi:hypothetical protein